MDFFAHGFWSFIFFHRFKNVRWAVFFGLLPDIISWVPFAFLIVLNGSFSWGPSDALPRWVQLSYGLGHSFVIIGFVLLAIFLIFKKLPLFVLAWPLAVFMDVLTHSREYFPTPFLWPLSDFTFNGIPWASASFMVLNWVLIVGSLIYISKYSRIGTKKPKVRMC